jgi:hypothetical protein
MASKNKPKLWWAIPLLMITFPLAIVAGLLSKPQPKSAGALVDDLERLIEFAEGRRDWDLDEFEAVSLADPELERIRLAAVRAGSRLPALRGLLAEAKHLADTRRSSAA